MSSRFFICATFIITTTYFRYDSVKHETSDNDDDDNDDDNHEDTSPSSIKDVLHKRHKKTAKAYMHKLPPGLSSKISVQVTYDNDNNDDDDNHDEISPSSIKDKLRNWRKKTIHKVPPVLSTISARDRMCKICRKTFGYRCGLTLHLRSAHYMKSHRQYVLKLLELYKMTRKTTQHKGSGNISGENKAICTNDRLDSGCDGNGVGNCAQSGNSKITEKDSKFSAIIGQNDRICRNVLLNSTNGEKISENCALSGNRGNISVAQQRQSENTRITENNSKCCGISESKTKMDGNISGNSTICANTEISGNSAFSQNGETNSGNYSADNESISENSTISGNKGNHDENVGGICGNNGNGENNNGNSAIKFRGNRVNDGINSLISRNTAGNPAINGIDTLGGNTENTSVNSAIIRNNMDICEEISGKSGNTEISGNSAICRNSGTTIGSNANSGTISGKDENICGNSANNGNNNDICGEISGKSGNTEITGNSPKSGNNNVNSGGNTKITENTSGNTETSGNSTNTETSRNSRNTETRENSTNTKTSGNSANTEICGNSGNTETSGNSANTEISGNSGNTETSGNSANTEISGNSGNTETSGNSANSGNSKQYGCELCGKKFRFWSNFTYHHSINHGTRKHKCQRCNNKFYNVLDLQDHVRRKHAGLVGKHRYIFG